MFVYITTIDIDVNVDAIDVMIGIIAAKLLSYLAVQVVRTALCHTGTQSPACWPSLGSIGVLRLEVIVFGGRGAGDYLS